jgi:hypothetical protein
MAIPFPFEFRQATEPLRRDRRLFASLHGSQDHEAELAIETK